MNNSDERDYAEESANRAEMTEGDACTQDHAAWVSGMMYVSPEDVQATYDELKRNNISRDIECETCGGVYVPGKSFDPYGF